MDAQYQRIVADPGLKLSEAKEAYRLAIAAQQQHARMIADKEREIDGQRGKIDNSPEDVARIEAQLAQLRQDRDGARVTRLERELSRTDSITISNAVTCARNETIAGCIERSEQAARDAALSGFAERLFAATTEKAVVTELRGEDSLALTLEGSQVTSGGFRGQSDYLVELEARVTSRIPPPEACRLLGIAADQCSGLTSRALAVDDDEDGTYRLTVRSNVYYDDVLINGTPYGSTRLDVLLPPGEYEVEVRKPGYTSWRDRVTLDGAVTVIAELTEQ